MSKRSFLFGAVAGGCALQAAHWAAPAVLGRLRGTPPHQVTFAQCGEDLIVSYILSELGVDRPTYIDVGAYHPYEINNTYLFYARGCRGILVEPNVDMIPLLRRERPGDTTLNVGIGLTSATEADYYRINEPSWNTFDKDVAEHYVKSSGGEKKIVEVIKVPLVNINEVLARHHGGVCPDFVSLDVEGLELDILKSLDWSRYRPKVVCIETLVTNTRRQKLEAVEFLVGKGYVARGSTFVNTILVDGSLLT
ncbi:FkbM family methyltransferase [bacterium]|nr:FkbM family methyltransferase [bacterium]